jgi:hypothetical protein
MTTPKLHPDLSAFLCCLAKHRVRFVVIGAHVLATLGRPRYTDDLDVLVEPNPANARRLAAAFRDFGYGELAAKAAEHFAAEERMATLGRPPVAIDILTSTKGLTFDEAWADRTVLRIGRSQVGFLGLASYVKTKLACGRTKDLLDIELLREAGLLNQKPGTKLAAKPVYPSSPKKRKKPLQGKRSAATTRRTGPKRK